MSRRLIEIPNNIAAFLPPGLARVGNAVSVERTYDARAFGSGGPSLSTFSNMHRPRSACPGRCHLVKLRAMEVPQTEVIVTRGGAEPARHVFAPGEYVIGREAD